MASLYYTLSDTYGDPPRHGGGWIVGSDGSSLAELRQDLERRYGNRLTSIDDGQAAADPLPAVQAKPQQPL